MDIFEKAKELIEEDFKGLKEDFNLFPTVKEISRTRSLSNSRTFFS